MIMEERFDMAAKGQDIEKDELYKKTIQRIERHGIKKTWFSDPLSNVCNEQSFIDRGVPWCSP